MGKDLMNLINNYDVASDKLVEMLDRERNSKIIMERKISSLESELSGMNFYKQQEPIVNIQNNPYEMPELTETNPSDADSDNQNAFMKQNEPIILDDQKPECKPNSNYDAFNPFGGNQNMNDEQETLDLISTDQQPINQAIDKFMMDSQENLEEAKPEENLDDLLKKNEETKNEPGNLENE